VFLIGYACKQPKSEIDGLWVSAYQIQTVPNRGIGDYKKIMRIDGDSVFFKTTGDPKSDIRAWNKKSKFKRTADGIEAENEDLNKIYIHEISDDSVVISYETKNSTKEVFKKLNQPMNKIDWNPSEKSYSFEGNSGFVNIKFLENGLFVDCLKEKEDVSVGHWYTIEEKKNLFVVLDNMIPIALTVDSLLQDNVYLSIEDENKYDYTLKEMNLEIPENLLGDWSLVTCDTLRTELWPLPKSGKWSTLDFLRIRKDSIQIIKNKIESTKKWTIGGANDLMIFPDVILEKDSLKRNTLTKKERIVRSNIFKIDSLSENNLVLLTEYMLAEFDGFEIKLTYRREKN